MNLHRIVSFIIYAVLALIVGSLAWTALFKSGGSGQGGMGYGNLHVSYSWEARGVLPDRLNWLIATPQMPTDQAYESRKQITFQFKNGKEFSFEADSKNLIWIDPESGPTKIKLELTKALLDRLNETDEAMNDTQFKTPEELIAALETK